MTTLTNYYKQFFRRNLEFILLWFWRLEVQNPHHWAEVKYHRLYYFLRGSREESAVCLHQFLVVARIPWLVIAVLGSSKPASAKLSLLILHIIVSLCVRFPSTCLL